MANEIDALDPIPEQVKLNSGLVVQLQSLRARQFFKLLRIITHGALPGLRDSGLFDTDDLTPDEFTVKLLSVTLMSIPDAEDETIDFVRSMCAPAGLIERRNLNKQDQERNDLLWQALEFELENPTLDDLVTLLEAVVRRESEDMLALGKRLASMFKLAQKTGQVSASPPPPESTSASSVESPARSTSSRRTTTGRTKSSSTSPSADYVNVSLPSESESTTPVGSISNG